MSPPRTLSGMAAMHREPVRSGALPLYYLHLAGVQVQDPWPRPWPPVRSIRRVRALQPHRRVRTDHGDPAGRGGPGSASTMLDTVRSLERRGPRPASTGPARPASTLVALTLEGWLSTVRPAAVTSSWPMPPPCSSGCRRPRDCRRPVGARRRRPRCRGGGRNRRRVTAPVTTVVRARLASNEPARFLPGCPTGATRCGRSG